EGFFYRVVGGDARTDEFYVDVRSSPLIENDRFLATYHPRAYRKQVDRVEARERKLRDYRGTEVALEVHTNRKLREGAIELLKEEQTPDGKKQTKETVRATLTPNDPGAMTLKFELKRGMVHYVLRF